ncbi:glycosyltransferase family 4 protein [Butyrivibrio sp. AE3004]|uniref:glycosyltransferase family 4 protein n=1 Tax=Butyrivibrio sp. AE3004 TaxID=1506994 RepID=UPI000689695C|nr:glycosyltransferase family 4 protein [Butyrivibrio sp. AE3004]
MSNYINHHQIPLCDELYSALGKDFFFIESQPMDEARKNMGWNSDTAGISYVKRMYEDMETCSKLIMDCDVMILGWTGQDKNAPSEQVIRDRLSSGKPVVRVSERIYREGRWKAVSPRGLKAKYEEHIKFRNAPVYMLCSGAYVSGDFKMIGAYPDKMYKWGYFPPFKIYSKEELEELLYKDKKKLHICFAARLIKLKHPELAVETAKHLRNISVDFSLDILGDGPLFSDIQELIKSEKLEDYVFMHGSLKPEAVRGIMEKSDVFIFASNYLEGWGAVVNEAMNSACVVVASSEAGAVPYLIKDGVNGFTFDSCDKEKLIKKIDALFLDNDATISENVRDRKAPTLNADYVRKLQKEAYLTIRENWNAKNAAERLLVFCESITSGSNFSPYEDGPLSRANVIKAPGFMRTVQEDNHLE